MEIIQQEVQADREFIRQKVIEHNAANLPDSVKHPIDQLSFMAKNENGEIIGGITATGIWQHLHIDFLWVDSSARGQRIAERLMQQLEGYARRQNYRLMVVDTFSFQAPGFYIKQGFQEFGVIENHPEGHSQHYFEKRLMG